MLSLLIAFIFALPMDTNASEPTVDGSSGHKLKRLKKLSIVVPIDGQDAAALPSGLINDDDDDDNDEPLPKRRRKSPPPAPRLQRQTKTFEQALEEWEENQKEEQAATEAINNMNVGE